MYKIAISGKAKSGKNTLSSLIIDELAKMNMNNIQVLAFADPIKRMALEMFPFCDRNCLYGPSELRQNIINKSIKDQNGEPLTYRQLLCDLGKLGRSYDPDIWIKAFHKQYKNAGKANACIATDLRFVNEFTYLKGEKFYMVRIKRKDNLNSTDISETQQDEILDSSFDFIVDNNKTLKNLRDQVKEMLQIIEE